MASGKIDLSSSKAWAGYIEWTSTPDVASNTSLVTAKLYGYKTDGYTTGGNTNGFAGTLTINGSSKSFNYTDERTSAEEHCSYSVTVYHDDATGAAKITISGSVKGASGTSLSSTTLSGSKSVSLNTIARASELSVSNGTLGTAQTITADRKNDSFTHTLTWKSPNQSGTIGMKENKTSWSFTPPLTLASDVPNGISLSVTFTLQTYNGSTLIGTKTKTVTMSVPDSVKPSASIAVSDTTTAFAELGKYLQGKSALKIDVTASGVYGSTISSYSVTVDGDTYTKASFTTPALKNYGELSIKATVKDSRNRSTTIEYKIEVQSYDFPRITRLTVIRCNAHGVEDISGAYAQVTYSFSTSSVSTGNPQLKYKKTSESYYTVINLPKGQSAENATKIFPADDGSSYDIELEITDNFGTASRKTVLSTAFSILHFGQNGRGMAIGKISERSGLDIGMMTYFRAGIGADAIPVSADFNTILNVGKYVMNSNANMKTLSNRPCDIAGSLYVISILNPELTTFTGAYQYFLQVFLTYQGDLYVRSIQTGTSLQSVIPGAWVKKF